MSFHLSADEDSITVDGGVLRARLRNEDGDMCDAEINLNEFIGNSDGRFEWGGVNFAESAENITFAIEGDGEVPVLRADLRNAEGELVHADINLAERVVNQNGQFVFE